MFSEKIEPTERNPLEVIWSAQDGHTQVHYIDDPFVDLKYLALIGPGSEGLADLAHSSLGAMTPFREMDVGERVRSRKSELAG